MAHDKKKYKTAAFDLERVEDDVIRTVDCIHTALSPVLCFSFFGNDVQPFFFVYLTQLTAVLRLRLLRLSETVFALLRLSFVIVFNVTNNHKEIFFLCR